MYSKIQYISQGDTVPLQLNAIKTALDAGCNWIQLRYKDVSENEVLRLAERVKKATDGYECTFIINDYPRVANYVEADGIHLGLTDMPVAVARTILGPGKIIGGTANTLGDIMQRYNEQCDYIGLGPFRFTATKQKLSPVLGMAGYATIMNQLKELDIKTPIYAIGGIEEQDIEPLIKAGIYGVALSGLITRHPHKKELLSKLNILCSH